MAIWLLGLMVGVLADPFGAKSHHQCLALDAGNLSPGLSFLQLKASDTQKALSNRESACTFGLGEPCVKALIGSSGCCAALEPRPLPARFGELYGLYLQVPARRWPMYQQQVLLSS